MCVWLCDKNINTFEVIEIIFVSIIAALDIILSPLFPLSTKLFFLKMIHFASATSKNNFTGRKQTTEHCPKEPNKSFYLQQRAGNPLRVSLHVKNMELAARTCARVGGHLSGIFLAAPDTFHLETWQLLVCQSMGGWLQKLCGSGDIFQIITSADECWLSEPPAPKLPPAQPRPITEHCVKERDTKATRPSVPQQKWTEEMGGEGVIFSL